MNSETTYSLDRDLREAEAMADGLIPYLHQDRLYGNVGSGGLFGGGTMPSLTIGALLMRLHRLSALSDNLTDAQREQLRRIAAKHDEARDEWRLHYTERLVQEAKSRLKAMDTFFEECNDNPRNCARNYLPETLRRTIVHEIDRALTALGAESADVDRAIRHADGKLRRYVAPSAFVWAKALEPAYPPAEYWWLHAQPAAPES
jgi:hypothetical protein